ncbi:hypothetical protein [Xenorhabdus thuongxuanensis]|uniref:Uncharacterized protein n=1 Tax=Xenorhabdus thuongxuanensis TaxID=1873484 RepID=A0A1Q5TM02_9GAMM|nr:hypothetical protein [Xenorhabdus thuongxuanensis]OKP01263.1 hypothetical protein Xentx_03436 [Xenorhabdus thuongxuanensis]
MKKYLLLCLLAGVTLSASMQTYAMVCSIWVIPKMREACIAQCEAAHPGWLNKIACV